MDRGVPSGSERPLWSASALLLATNLVWILAVALNLMGPLGPFTRGEWTEGSHQVQSDREDPDQICREQESGGGPQRRGRIAEQTRRRSVHRQSLVLLQEPPKLDGV